MRKNREKLVWLLVALCMLLASSGAVYAEGEATITDISKETTVDVSAYSMGAQTESTVYSVTIDWGSMEFKYTPAFKGNWNTETRKYDDATPEKWEPIQEGENTITVYNYSEVPVRVSYGFSDSIDEVDLGFRFIDRSTSIECGKSEDEKHYTDINFGRFQRPDGSDDGVYSSAVNFEVTSGKLPGEYEEGLKKIGSITITVAEAPEGASTAE